VAFRLRRLGRGRATEVAWHAGERHGRERWLPRCSASARQADVVGAFEPERPGVPNHEPNPLLRRTGVHREPDGRAEKKRFVGSPTTVTLTLLSSSTPSGEFIRADFVTALVPAQSCSRAKPGGKVIYDVRASWAVPKGRIRRDGGGVPRIKRGRTLFIKQRDGGATRAQSSTEVLGGN